MKLKDKGRFAPPPRLPAHAQTVSEAVAALPDVHARTHWYLGDESVVDGADFYVGEDEIGHIHLDGEAHIAMSRALRAALTASGLAEPFRWSAAFVVFRIRRASDVARALSLFDIAHARRSGASEADLLTRVEALATRAA